MKNDYLNHLKEIQDIVSESDGDSESRLCSNCPCTDYGMENNYYSSPTGFHSCEGSHCETATENAEDELIDEYTNRKEELNMKDAKMNVEIDLSVLEQNIVKMATDKIEDEVISTLVGRISKKVEEIVIEKTNQMIEKKVNNITENDIYNVKVNVDGEEVNLFDLMIQKMVKQANDKYIQFSDTVEELLESIEYKPVDEDFKDNEFKVLTTYTNGEYGTTGMSIEINGRNVFSIGEGEPEDMTLNRDLNDVLDVPSLLKKAYLAGKSGKVMYEASETE